MPVVLCLLAVPAHAGRRAKWAGPISTDGKPGYVVITGRLDADCAAIGGRWKCTGAGCPKKRGALILGCDRFPDGAISPLAAKTCRIFSSACGSTGLVSTLQISVVCNFTRETSTARLTRQPTKRTPTCTP